jgi:hypothetical protein
VNDPPLQASPPDRQKWRWRVTPAARYPARRAFLGRRCHAFACAPLFLFAGCAAQQAKQDILLPPIPPTSQPAALDVQQLSGQVAAAVKAELHAAVNAQVNATGIYSEFGPGAAIAVNVTLVLTIVLSHWREMRRIRANGKH